MAIATTAAVVLAAARQRRARERTKPWKRKSGERFFEQGIGARSAAGGMTALSLRPNVREHRFQMHHYRGCAGDPLMSWRCKAAFFCSKERPKDQPKQTKPQKHQTQQQKSAAKALHLPGRQKKPNPQTLTAGGTYLHSYRFLTVPFSSTLSR
ncbi:MAG: hypothetical protein DI523_18110 [Paraburkholderia fungorum]|nr:MAG: hypothetical protein DI523_18110 [Paraburkholderia fungorum]